MKKLLLFWISIFWFILHAETYIPYGNVSGIWETENSPYYITGQISIPAAEQLLIEPGVEVIFLVWNPIKISGSLQAIGTETEPIKFTAEDTLSGWRGLRFYNTSTTAQDSSRIVHCQLEYGRNLTGIYSDTRGGAVYCYNSSNVLIDNCLIRNCTANYGGGISLQQSSIIVRNTIISGNTAEHDGGGLLISMESSPHLENCRFINNTSRYDGGGIFVSGGSSAFLENMMIDGNQATDGMDGSGGGISCWGSDLYLSESVLSNNSSQEHGGGIELNLESTASLSNVDIIGNNSFYGGGLSVMDSYLTLEQVLISGNCAQYGGGGITLSNGSEIVFDPVNRCNLYLNFAGEGNGYDILNFYNTINVSVIVDTFTVENPTQVHTYPIDNFEFDIQNWKVNPTTEDVYVSPEGLDSNSGLSEEDPVKTIFQALLMAQATEEDPITIHLAEGFYSPSSTGELFPVSAKDYITISGSGEEISILDAQGSGNVISSNSINYFALKDLSIQGGYAYYGGGIYCYSSLLEINNVTICNNFSESNGGGIRANSSSEMYLNNVTLKRNRADQNGGGLESYGSFIYLNSVTVSENTAMNKGGGIAINNSQLNFNEDLRSNVYFNISVNKQGHELYSQNSSITEVIVDTFLVTVPTTEHANPISAFTFDILQAAHETISSDVYVSPAGNNQNSGTSENEPLQSIAFAIQIISADEENPATIHLAQGIYAASVNQELLPLVGRDHISLCGNDTANTILDAENGSGLIKSYADNLTIENLTLRHARDNTYNSMGVIEISGENLILKNLIIEENETLHTPGGLSLY
ncbi:MAG: hypothetical protein JW996_03575, partial [Candidatus Cloacimonetes bacterium]|nr:hypothetical protein [Candidatus Cloacimonadota bacterium]